jgi:GNAT superfamily N-acetyltransferase
LNLRPATPADVRAIAELHVASWRAGYRGLVDQAVLDGLSVDERTAQWREHVERVTVLVADDGDSLAGFVAFSPATGEIGALYVAPERFRQGTGSALIEAAHEAIAAAGRDEAVLWVFAANAGGRAFYAAHGYEPDGAAATEPRSGLEEVRMWRNLPRNTRGRP